MDVNIRRLAIHKLFCDFRYRIKKEFSQSSVIDVYDLRTNTYKLSFYLPDYNKKENTRDYRF